MKIEGKLVSICSKCQAGLSAGAKFCAQCGQAISDRPLESEIERERKFVSILFADLNGFTALSERLDPEELTEIIDRCFKRLGPVVNRYEGYIDKFMGDSIMALFGAPVTHENDAERAISCALDMIEELQRLNQELKLNLTMSFGINSGIVIAGGIGAEGKMDYTVMGDAVNVAQRIQKAAPSNSVYVTRNVFRAAEKSFTFEERSALTLKGKTQSVDVFSVLERHEVKEERETIHRSYSKLVGRDREFESIRQLMNAIPERSSAVFVYGEAGSGKSRLLHELKKYSVRKQILWVATFPQTMAKDSSLETWVRILKQLKDFWPIKELSNDSLTATMLESLLSETSSETLSRQDKEAQKKATFLAIRSALKSACEKARICLVFEDAHQMDSLSVELLRLILSDLNFTNLMILISSRPEGLTSFQDLTNIPQMKLQSLSANASIQLAQFLLKKSELPESLKRIIIERGDGNPLFIEEVIKSLIDTKQICFQNDEWKIAEQLDATEIPQSLHALLMARIDRLEPNARLTLQLASVAGRSFDDFLLGETGLIKDGLFSLLRTLRKKELIFEYDAEDDRVHYTFKHSLIREVAYESLLQKKRRAFHGEIARVIESHFEYQENRIERLAHHFSQAQSPRKAIDYIQLCAQKNEATYDQNRAIEYFEEALKIANSAPLDDIEIRNRIPDLTHRLTFVLFITGNFKDAEVKLQALLKTLQIDGPSPLLAQTLRRLGEIDQRCGRIDEALHHLYESLRIAEEIKDLRQQVRTCKSLASTLLIKNDLDGALEFLNRGIASVQKLKDVRLEADFWNDLAAVHIKRTSYDRALECLNLSNALCEMIGDMKVTQLSIAINQGALHYFLNDKETAVEKWKVGTTLAKEVGDPHNLIIARHNIGEVALEQSNFSTALLEFEDGFQLAERFGLEHFRIKEAAFKSAALMGLNKDAEAEPMLTDARKDAEKNQLWNEYVESTRFLSQLLDKKGEDEKVRDLLYETQTKLKFHKLTELETSVAQLRESFIRQKNQKLSGA